MKSRKRKNKARDKFLLAIADAVVVALDCNAQNSRAQEESDNLADEIGRFKDAIGED